MKKKVSMKDIAQQLGVSTALVSYVLNNQLEDRINKDTAEKIKQLAAELHYQPNHIAKSLKNNKTFTIGLILADISNPFSATLARIIEDEAKKNNYTVIFGSADESAKKSQDLINVLLSRQVDGFIIAPAEGSESQLIDLQEQDIPFVLIDRYFENSTFNHVIIDNYKASFNAIQHLIDNGYKNIGMLNFKTSLFHLHERVRGYKDAIIASGINFNEENVKEVNEKEIHTDTARCINELINGENPIDALFFGSNNLAIEGMICIKNLNLQLPENLAVVCFDEANAYNLFHTPLTYVSQPLAELGQKSVSLLIENMTNAQSHQSIVLDASLVIKKSSAKRN
jgi:LacI family transcriptional regulator